ncbi:MAG: inositol monophosphatase [Acidimicrobiales bacterium]|nr:inositol monophosphatase [Acidimicrobiales bacterium]
MTDPGEHPDTAALLTLAVDVAAEAAALLVEVLPGPRTVETKSTSTDMVTEMDRAAERLIVDRLLAVRPDDGIIGEEGAERRGTSGIEWVIDPIDGTTNYLYRFPGFAVSIAARTATGAVVGVVHDPLHGEVFTARRGLGARRNGEPLTVSTETVLQHALVATGFGYDPVRRAHQADVLRELVPRIRDVRRMGAASVDLCSVACGRVDAYFEKGLAPWDHAAGALIASEAGARVGDLDGGPLDGDFCLAAPPALFEPLRELLAGLGAADV